MRVHHANQLNTGESAHDSGLQEPVLSKTVERIAMRYGIYLMGLRYNDANLYVIRSKLGERPRLRIKYDPEDLGKITVWDPVDGRYLPVHCTNPVHAKGVSERQHLDVLRHQRACPVQIDPKSVMATMRDNLQTVDKARRAQKKAKFQQEVATPRRVEQAVFGEPVEEFGAASLPSRGIR